MDILRDINDIFKDVLDNDDLVITNETTSADVEDWDSLNHIQLVVAIEKHFLVKFSSAEIYSWKDVGEMCDAIALKLKKG
jgi:acyl carrier protein